MSDDERRTVERTAVWALMDVVPGKEREAEEHLRHSGALVEDEQGTPSFFAVKLGDGRYGVFTTFADDDALHAHISGPAGRDNLSAVIGVLFTGPPSILRAEVLFSKPHGH